VLRFTGFAWAMISGATKEVPPEFVRFRRREQMERLKKFVFRR
jgi:hypothetical protein